MSTTSNEPKATKAKRNSSRQFEKRDNCRQPQQRGTPRWIPAQMTYRSFAAAKSLQTERRAGLNEPITRRVAGCTQSTPCTPEFVHFDKQIQTDEINDFEFLKTALDKCSVHPQSDTLSVKKDVASEGEIGYERDAAVTGSVGNMSAASSHPVNASTACAPEECYEPGIYKVFTYNPKRQTIGPYPGAVFMPGAGILPGVVPTVIAVISNLNKAEQEISEDTIRDIKGYRGKKTTPAAVKEDNGAVMQKIHPSQLSFQEVEFMKPAVSMTDKLDSEAQFNPTSTESQLKCALANEPSICYCRN